MSVIDIQNLTFSYDGSYDYIFKNVSFRIDTDWKLGFTGRNGRGKTTFLNLLMGKYEYGGSITSGAGFEYFPYAIEDYNDIVLNVLNRMNNGLEYWEIVKEISKMSVSEDVLYRPFSTLSNGEQTKVLLAVMFLKENSFLLIDEPTNHLDLEGREIVADYLSRKKGFILVSHDRRFLDTCVDHILSINKTDIEIQAGNFSSWLYNKALKDNYEADQNDKLKKEIGRLQETAKEKAKWSDKTESEKIGTHQADRGYIGHKAAKMMRRSKAIATRIDKNIEEKSKLLKNIENTDKLKIHPLAHHAERLVELNNISICYGDKQVCGNITFTIAQGDRACLYGRNGNGKSSILKLICGNAISYTGKLNIASGLKISYVDQNTSGLSGSLDEYASACGVDISLFKAILRKLDFSRIQFEKDISAFSSGQKKKVLIARSLSQQAHLYVWDEPLNYIDILSRMQIEDLLRAYKPTMLFVEHDRAFCENIADKIIHLTQN